MADELTSEKLDELERLELTHRGGDICAARVALAELAVHIPALIAAAKERGTCEATAKRMRDAAYNVGQKHAEICEENKRLRERMRLLEGARSCQTCCYWQRTGKASCGRCELLGIISVGEEFFCRGYWSPTMQESMSNHEGKPLLAAVLAAIGVCWPEEREIPERLITALFDLIVRKRPLKEVDVVLQPRKEPKR